MEASPRMSALRGEADLAYVMTLCPLLTQSGHATRLHSALEDVGCNDPLPDAEHIRVVRIDTDLDPMMVGSAESLKPGEVFNGRKDRRALNSRGERLVSSEEVTVAMDDDDRLSKCNSFLLQQHPNVGEAVRVLFWRSGRRGMCRKDVGLLQDHNRTTVAGFRGFEALLQPSEVCLVALGVLSVAVRRAAEAVVTTGDVQRYERHAAESPTDVLAVFLKNGIRTLALVNQGHRVPAEALFARKEDFAHMGKPFQRVATFNPPVARGSRSIRCRLAYR